MAIMYLSEEYAMAKARTDRSLQLSSEERLQLESLAASRSLPAALVRRAKIILLTEEGMSDREAARRLSVAQPTVSMWRRRFRAGRLNGLHDELKPGRPRSHDEEQLAHLLNTALKQKPSTSTHWSVRGLEHTPPAHLAPRWPSNDHRALAHSTGNTRYSTPGV